MKMTQTAQKTSKYKISYIDNLGNFRQRYLSAIDEREAVIDCWLNNKSVVEPISVVKV